MSLYKRAIIYLSLLSFAAGLAIGWNPQIANAATTDNSAPTSWLRIIDISSYQPNIDWGQLSRAGIAGVYIKATEGNWYTNPYAASQRAGASSIGMPYGGYDFARPTDNAVSDAQYFVANGGAQGTLPPVLDMETEAPGAVQWAVTWLNTVKQLTGRTPTIYTGQYSWFYDATLTAWPLWVAAYPLGYGHVAGDNPANVAWASESTGAWSGWSLWQFTSVGQIYGVPGNVDVSAVTPQWWAYATGGEVAPSGTPITPSGQTTRYAAGVYGPGSSGSNVVWIQKIVGATPDGSYGPNTAAKVAAFQTALHIGADGIWGPITQNATNNLFAYLAAIAAHPSTQCSSTYISYGAHNSCVAYLQSRLGISNDGVWGNQTQNAVINFQRSHGLVADGIVGPRTWSTVG